MQDHSYQAIYKSGRGTHGDEHIHIWQAIAKAL